MSDDLPGASAHALPKLKAITTVAASPMNLPQSHGDTEVRKEGETRRRGDKETRRFSPCPLVSLSPCLLVLSLCLCVSVAYFFFRFIKRLHQRLSDSAKWRR